MEEDRIPPPAILTTTSENGGEELLPKRKVKFQCGLFREEETFIGEDVEILCAESLLEYVADLLESRVSYTIH